MKMEIWKMHWQYTQAHTHTSVYMCLHQRMLLQQPHVQLWHATAYVNVNCKTNAYSHTCTFMQKIIRTKYSCFCRINNAYSGGGDSS